MLISKFKSTFTNFHRPNLYRVYFNNPSAISAAISGDSTFQGEDINFLCKDATLPFFTLNNKQFMLGNRKHNIVQDLDYDPANFVFYVDDQNKLFTFINDWLSLQVNSDHQLGYKDEYVGNVEVDLLDSKGNVKMVGILLNAYPTNVNDMSISYEQNDTVSTLAVNFVFDEIIYLVNNTQSISAKEEYDSHMEKRQDPYLDKSLFGRFFNSVGYPLEELRKRVGGVIGQENLRKIESRLNVNVNDSITSGNNLTRKAEKNFSIASNASSNASEAVTKPFF